MEHDETVVETSDIYKSLDEHERTKLKTVVSQTELTELRSAQATQVSCETARRSGAAFVKSSPLVESAMLPLLSFPLGPIGQWKCSPGRPLPDFRTSDPHRSS